MSQDSIEQPLLLNQSIKDSIEQPPPVDPSPIKQLMTENIKQQPSSIQPIIQEIEEEHPHIQPFKETQQQHQSGRLVMTYNNSEKPRQKLRTQSIMTEAQALPKGKLIYRVMRTCSVVCILIAIVFIFALPPFLEKAIVSAAIDEIVLTEDNQDLWAHFPGKSATIIVRNFTFHRLMNQENFLLRHQKPQFQEVSGFKIQQLEDFLDIIYFDNGNKVKIRDWVRFQQWNQSKSLDEKVSVLNMGNLGYWSTLKGARPTLLLQQGLALLFTNMEQSILPLLIGTGINSQFLPNSSIAVSSLLVPAEIEQENFDFLWNDPSFGMSSPQNLGQWAEAALECFNNPQSIYQFSEKASVLKNYFLLSDTQLHYLMQKFYNYIVNLKHLLIQNHYCAGVDPSNCTGRYLAIAQMTEGWVSAQPPPVSTIQPNDTICDNNNTCKGFYPELFAFEKNVYWGSHHQPSQQNSEITFKREQIEAWFNYNKSVTHGLDYNTAQDCLLHIGNLDQIWEWGTNYDKDYDEMGMQKIRKRLKLDNQTQSKVVWQWLKYMAKQFVLQKSTNDKLGVSNLFTQGFYEQFALLQDNLQPFLLHKMVKKYLQGKECHLFFQATLDEPEGSPIVSNLCNHYTDIHSQQFTDFIISSCEEKFGPAWQELRSMGVSLLDLEYHCQINGGNNMGSILHNLKVQLDQWYNCSVTPKPYCSNFELATKQWMNSSVTLRPPSSLKDQLQSTNTFHDWNQNIKSFEYGFFLGKFTSEQRVGFPIFSTEELYPVLTFEEWFSATTVLRHFISGSFGAQFLRYIRWLSITITLRGFTTTRTARQLMFGYEDQFLAEVKNAYPPFGGDPSAPSFIALNDLNVTQEEATDTIVFLTGKDDFRNVYQNYEINGYRYSVNNYSWFDGNRTKWAWKSPWAEEDYFYGTTAKIFAPNQFQADNLSLLIPQVQRYGSNFFHNQSFLNPRFGMDLYISYLNPYIGQVAPHNDKYYQTIKNVFNVSSIYGLPFYITKNHFMNCTQWLELVDIYNQDYSIRYQEISHWDDTFILVEPYTGVSFQSVIYLQNNFYHQPDALYTYPIGTMLPIFSISRSGNLTEEKFHELFDPLVMGLKFKQVVVYIGIGLALLSIVMFLFSYYKMRKANKKEKVHSTLGVSLQPYKEEIEEPKQRMTLEVQDD